MKTKQNNTENERKNTQSIEIIELPVKWQHISGSRLNIALDGAIMILKLFILKIKY